MTPMMMAMIKDVMSVMFFSQIRMELNRVQSPTEISLVEERASSDGRQSTVS